VSEESVSTCGSAAGIDKARACLRGAALELASAASTRAAAVHMPPHSLPLLHQVCLCLCMCQRVSTAHGGQALLKWPARAHHGEEQPHHAQKGGARRVGKARTVGHNGHDLQQALRHELKRAKSIRTDSTNGTVMNTPAETIQLKRTVKCHRSTRTRVPDSAAQPAAHAFSFASSPRRDEPAALDSPVPAATARRIASLATPLEAKPTGPSPCPSASDARGQRMLRTRSGDAALPRGHHETVSERTEAG
jgi:hypothetical protein